MVALVEFGTPTAEGARVLAYMHEQITAAEAGSLATLNALPSPIKQFYAMVVKMHVMTEAEWLKSYPDNGATIFNHLVRLDEANAQREAETAEKTRIVESLDDVKAALSVALQRIADLEAAQQKPAEEPTPEPEAEAAPVESKKARKTKTEAEPVEVEAETEA